MKIAQYQCFEGVLEAFLSQRAPVLHHPRANDLVLEALEAVDVCAAAGAKGHRPRGHRRGPPSRPSLGSRRLKVVKEDFHPFPLHFKADKPTLGLKDVHSHQENAS